MKPIAIIMAAAALAAVPAVQAQEALAKASGCLMCHAVDGKKIGPSFKDTAAKHKGEAGAEAALCAKIAEGKAHPTVKASAEDTKALVKWILAM